MSDIIWTPENPNMSADVYHDSVGRLDTRQILWNHNHGDISVLATWVTTEDEGHEPCIVLYKTHSRSTCCAIALSSAFKYDDPKYAALASKGICEDLGIEPTIQNVVRIGGLIDNYLEDLIQIPPRPKIGIKESLGEFVMTTENGQRIEKEIFKHD